MVILIDRGLLDGSAYLSEAEWEQVQEQMGLSYLAMRDRYDAVVHLETAASGAEEFYETMVEVEPRYETP